MINYLIDQKSFAFAYPAQAAKIVQTTDYFLTSCLGATLKLIAIIDTDRHPGKRATFTMDEINALKVALKQFTYDAYGKRLGVSIELWYIGNQAPSILQEPTVQSMNVTSHQFWLSSWAFDICAKDITCNSLSIRNLLRRRILAKVFKDIIKSHCSIRKEYSDSFSFAQ